MRRLLLNLLDLGWCHGAKYGLGLSWVLSTWTQTARMLCLTFWRKMDELNMPNQWSHNEARRQSPHVLFWLSLPVSRLFFDDQSSASWRDLKTGLKLVSQLKHEGRLDTWSTETLGDSLRHGYAGPQLTHVPTRHANKVTWNVHVECRINQNCTFVYFTTSCHKSASQTHSTYYGPIARSKPS